MAEQERKRRAGGKIGVRRSMSDSEEPTLFGAPVTAHPLELARAKAKQKAEDSRQGHRKRLRDRFMDGGEDAMPDYELLEMVLCRAIIQGDVKPLAKDLLKTFGTFSGVVNATPMRLVEVRGVGPRVIQELKLVRAAARRMLQAEMKGRDLLASWQSVIDYLQAAQGHDDKEAFRILFLDKRNQLIADEVQQRGTVDHTPVYVREVIARSLELSATAIILVHNHPSGDPSPSRADIDMTKLIIAAGQPLGVTVHDHIIVGRKGHFSMKSSRVI